MGPFHPYWPLKIINPKIININLTPFEPKAMRVSYEKSKTRENLATFVVG
jgi:hypothetical protein